MLRTSYVSYEKKKKRFVRFDKEGYEIPTGTVIHFILPVERIYLPAGLDILLLEKNGAGALNSCRVIACDGPGQDRGTDRTPLQ